MFTNIATRDDALKFLVKEAIDEKFEKVRLPSRVPLYFDFVTTEVSIEFIAEYVRSLLYAEYDPHDIKIYTPHGKPVHSFHIQPTNRIVRLIDPVVNDVRGFSRGAAVYDRTLRQLSITLHEHDIFCNVSQSVAKIAADLGVPLSDLFKEI